MTRREPGYGPWRPTVVKLGGSLASSGRLGTVLDIVLRATRPVVVVPGGGRFADAVRAEQARLGFSDEAAHKMALLAMHQTAFLLEGMNARVVSVERVAEMKAIWESGRLPAWLPYRLVAQTSSLPRDWSLTSDGLAAWLAERIGAVRVILCKACAIDPNASARALAECGIVDARFATIVERPDLPWNAFGPGDDALLAAALEPHAGDETPGM